MQNLSHKKFSVSKWLKTQVLLDHDEMRACVEALSPLEFYNVSSIVLRDQLKITHEAFLKAYGEYVTALKQGALPAVDRQIFSSIATVEPDAIYADEIQPGRWMAKLAKPVVQLQHHRFFASTNPAFKQETKCDSEAQPNRNGSDPNDEDHSREARPRRRDDLAKPQQASCHLFECRVSKIDHKIHPMVMSPESIYWGLQFAFPQIFFDGSGGSYTKTSDEKLFPNSGLFARLLKWLRDFAVPTTFVWDGHKVPTPLRLGKECFAWIENHPQLKEQGIKVHVY